MPAHNEQAYLTAAVEQVVLGLRARSRTFEVLVCENGSTDATADVAAGLAERFPEVRTVSWPVADYGKALRTGFLATAESGRRPSIRRLAFACRHPWSH